jgi:hypothetical protein
MLLGLAASDRHSVVSRLIDVVVGIVSSSVVGCLL